MYKVMSLGSADWLVQKNAGWLVVLAGVLIHFFMFCFPFFTRQQTVENRFSRPPIKKIIKELALAVPLVIGCFFMVILVQAVLSMILPNPPDIPETYSRLARSNGSTAIYLFMCMATFIGPVGEELFFRGFLFKALQTRLPFIIAVLGQAIIFGFVHSYGVVNASIAALLGVVLNLIYIWRKTLLTPVFVHMGYNGISMLSILLMMYSSAQAPVLGVVGDRPDKECVVVDIVPGSPADHAGILPGDKITGLGVFSVETFKHLTDGVAWYRAGETIEIVLERDGERLELQVELATRSSLAKPSE